VANYIFPKWKEAVVQHLPNSALTGVVKCAIVDTALYTYSASHEFFTSISAAVVGTPQTLASKTYTNGVLDAANPVFPSVTGATSEALVLYIDTGTAGTSRLVAYIDTGITGLPVTPNGSDINLTFDALGIFGL
jgi:hypothetical protein